MPDIAGPRQNRFTLGHLDSEVAGLEAGDSREQERLVAHATQRVDATGSSLHRCSLEMAGVEELGLDHARLVECELVAPEVTNVLARGGTWRSLAVTEGRIGALEAPGSHWDGVTLTSTRIGYLSARDGHVSDTTLEGCRVDTLDLTGATLSRVLLRDCVVGELVLTRARLADVDLRGTDLTHVEGILGLAGAAITYAQLLALAPSLAQACGLRVLPEE